MKPKKTMKETVHKEDSSKTLLFCLLVCFVCLSYGVGITVAHHSVFGLLVAMASVYGIFLVVKRIE